MLALYNTVLNHSPLVWPARLVHMHEWQAHSRGTRELLRDENGSTTLEFAIAIPVVILLVIGSMIVMIALLAYGNATYATQAAGRYASLHGATSDAPATSASVASQVQARLWLTSEAAQVTTAWPTNNQPGSIVNVVTTLTLPFGIPLTGTNQLTVRASASRVITR